MLLKTVALFMGQDYHQENELYWLGTLTLTDPEMT